MNMDLSAIVFLLRFDFSTVVIFWPRKGSRKTTPQCRNPSMCRCCHLMSNSSIVRIQKRQQGSGFANVQLLQVRWLQMLSQHPLIKEVPAFSPDARSILEETVSNFSVDNALAVKKVERVVKHDVKAVEYVLKDKFQAHPELSKVQNCEDNVLCCFEKMELTVNRRQETCLFY